MRRQWCIWVFFVVLGPALCLVTSAALAQDVIWALPRSTALIQNPAAAGSDAYFRASLQYRTSWSSVAAPYKTMAAAFDTRLATDRAARKTDGPPHGLGVGMSFVNDRTGDPELRSNIATAYCAYTVRTSEMGRLGAGVSVAFDNRRVDPLGEKWASQFNGYFYDPDLNSGEQFRGSGESHLGLGAGLRYTHVFKPKRGNYLPTRVLVGLAAHHLGRLRLSEADFVSRGLPMRMAATLDGQLPIGESSALVPGVFFQQQGGESDLMVGTSFKQLLVYGNSFIRDIKQSSVSAGLYYRAGRAVAIQGNLVWGAFGFGMSYGMDVSDLKSYSGQKSGFELVLVWKGAGTKP